MLVLNKEQLVVCWVLLALISLFIFIPAVYETGKYHKYEAEDGEYFTFKNGLFSGRAKGVEQKDKKGIYITKEALNRQKQGRYVKGGLYKVLKEREKRYYYKGLYTTYGLKGDVFRRLIAISLINGLLLIYTLGIRQKR